MLDTFGSVILLAVTIGSPMESLIHSEGRAVRNSLVIVGATDPAFGEALRVWLQRATFTSPTLEGRVVDQRITVPVTFTITP